MERGGVAVWPWGGVSPSGVVGVREAGVASGARLNGKGSCQ